MQNRRLSAQYLHVGRGGAAKLRFNRTRSQMVQSPSIAPSPPSSRNITPGSGRGGAGNLNSAMETKASEEQDELEKERSDAERRRERVEEQVDVMLQPPPSAVLSGSKRSSMFARTGVRQQCLRPNYSEMKQQRGRRMRVDKFGLVFLRVMLSP